MAKQVPNGRITNVGVTKVVEKSISTVIPVNLPIRNQTSNG
ncbi:hypothetical protein FOMG_03310 [Fusarium oxysporum f. sp. melonis 26406]|uniref:Uncharacterized protein n=1 Tax=Fusarium oxysporum f. sp. melonis 26406 TaxID=1089452 RepID=X0AVI4_FUSOX|nr:hypothetical protein FOMG_03310 [Fusarium oxysporum f. sp. melonis 26406]